MNPMMTSECAALIKSGYKYKASNALEYLRSRLSRCKEHNSLLRSQSES